MNLPLSKNKNWVSLLHKSIGHLDERLQAAIMKPCGQGCASDIIALAERLLGIRVSSIEHLVTGWNMIRESRGLTGRWEFEHGGIRGIFHECGCPLVTSGMIELHPVQCYCSKGMMETVFSRVAARPVAVELIGTIGRGDKSCHFLVKM